MTRSIILSLLALLCLNARAEEKVKKILYVKNAYIIDMLTNQPIQKGSVLIVDGRIKDITYQNSNETPENAEVIDAEGKYLMPGLIDAHAHVTTGREKDFDKLKTYSKDLLHKMLMGGITSIRDVGGKGELLKVLQDESASFEIKSPKIYYSAFFAGPSYYKQMGTSEFNACTQAVDSSTNVQEAMAKAKNAGASGVKLYAAINPELLRELAHEAKKQGLGVWGHATVMSAKPTDALNVGMEVMSHAEMLKWEQCPSLSMSMFDNYEKYYGKFKFDFPELDLLFEKMKEKNVILDATCYHGTVNGLKEAAIFTKKAHKMGVKVSAGTDYLGDQPLPYIHDELETFVKHCDFTPYEALRSATVIAAETFKMRSEIGTIEKGKIADLLLLYSNPLENISNTKDIHTVIKEGVIYKK
ncbi:amidohydrolase family protein [Marinifilum flexuosum]|uniref:amidohydrolase family protein n=1 Tax=Marinifilum flexuosum TaxID=1117708 RepID=UPI00248FD7BD|nr:amidohydrolase family protein [Marinifilum flexuosum]